MGRLGEGATGNEYGCDGHFDSLRLRVLFFRFGPTMIVFVDRPHVQYGLPVLRITKILCENGMRILRTSVNLTNHATCLKSLTEDTTLVVGGALAMNPHKLLFGVGPS